MRPKHTRKPLHDAAPKVRRPPGSPTKSQLRAIALAEARAHVAKWMTLIPVANATWSKLNTTELGRSQGDIHTLAGLVQMHYRVSRQEADSQVKAFFDLHIPATPVTAPLAAPVSPVVAPVIAAPEAEATRADTSAEAAT